MTGLSPDMNTATTSFHTLRGDSFVQDWRGTPSTSLTLAFESSDELNSLTFKVRAIDNIGAPDPTPAVKRFFTRKTIFPQTEILVPSNNQKLFVIDHTTDWWQGIQLSFTATDEDGEAVEYGWWVDGGDTVWTQDTTLAITPDQFQPPLTGDHTIKVTSRDNTNLIDPVGDSIIVRLVVPTFQKRILIIDETIENNFPFGVFPQNTPAEVKDDSVDSFYARVFGTTNSWDYSARGIPPRDTLGQYQLLIWHADDRPNNTPHALPQHEEVIKDYLNVGGDFIMSGWRILKSFAWDENFPQNFAEGTFVNDYLHIKSVNETPLAPADFIGTSTRTFSDTFRVDSDKLQEFPYFGKLGEVNIIPPDVGFAGFTELLYRYENDLQGLTWPRGNAVGLRYFGTSFDAVVLGFPMFFLQREDAIRMGRDILDSLGY